MREGGYWKEKKTGVADCVKEKGKHRNMWRKIVVNGRGTEGRSWQENVNEI